MNLQEQISRITSMMGVINESKFFRRRVNLDKVNELLKNRIITKPTQKVKEENNNIITNKEMVKTIFPSKKNRRNGDPIINIGGKFNT
jgi:hypothetical protein